MSKLGEFLVKISLGVALVIVLTAARRLELCVIAFAAVCMLIGVRRLSKSDFSGASAYVCGILLPVVPFLGESVLVSLVLVYMLVAGWREDTQRGVGLWAAPLLAYIVGSFLGEIAIALDLTGAGATSFLRDVSIDTPERFFDVWRELCQTHAHSWRWYARLLTFACAVDFFACSSRYRERFVKGLFIGISFSAVFAIVQWLDLLPFVLGNQTAFWSFIRRVSGLMSDPNALGLVMGLALWCVALRQLECTHTIRFVDVVWLIAVVGAGTISGSRTFLLASAILVVALMWQYARRFLLAAVVAGLVVVGSVTALDSYTQVIEQVQVSEKVPEGLKRGLPSVSLLRVSETLASRTLFLDIARVLVRGHTIFGVGADRFREDVPLVGVQSGLVKGWTDNANNLYVGIGVEFGVIGLILMLIVTAGRTRSAFGSAPLCTALLIGTAAIMLTGPHTDFPEVMLLVAFLVGSCTLQRPQSHSATAVIFAALLLGVYASYTREQGVFTWDDSDKGAVRWLSNRARIVLLCNENTGQSVPRAVATLRSVYVPQRAPLEVRVLRGDSLLQELSFTKSQEVLQFGIDCPRGIDRIPVTLVTKPAWSPYRAWPESSRDRRLLGVQQLVFRQ
jgi:hypothetical protein